MNEGSLAVPNSTMTPLLDFHDQSNSRPVPKQQAHRAPIIPAIPRQLEKKYLRTQTKASNSSSKLGQQLGNAHPSALGKRSIDGHIKASVSASGSLKDDSLDSASNRYEKSLAAKASYHESTQQLLSSPQELKRLATPQTSMSSTGSKTTSTQDFGISKYGNQLPPIFVPSEARQNYLSSKSTSPNPGIGTKPESAHVLRENNNSSVDGGKSGLHVSSASENLAVFPTSNQSTSSAGYLPPQKYFSHNCLDQIPSSFRIPRSSSDVNPSPTASVYQGYGHLPYVPTLPIQSSSYFDGNAGLHNVHQPSDSELYSQLRDMGPPLDSYCYTTPLQAVVGQLPFTPSITPFNRTITFQAPTDFSGPELYPEPSLSDLSSQLQSVQPCGVSSVQNCVSPDTPDRDLIVEMYSQDMSRSKSEQPPACTERGGPRAKVSLKAHLQSQFNDPIYADSRLQVDLSSTSVPIEYHVHTLLIVQSPLLKNLVEKSRKGARNGSLNLRSNDRFIKKSSIEAALRMCYGEPASGLGTNPGYLDTEAMSLARSTNRMSTALAYIATGHWFELPDLALRGIELASENLNYQTIKSVLSLVFDGGLGTEWVGDPEASREQEEFERTFTCSSATDSEDGMNSDNGMSGVDEVASEYWVAPKPRSGPTYQPYANQLLHRCLLFLSLWASGPWKLETSAKPARFIDRLPVTTESHSSSTKARLSRIKFGDFVCGDDAQNLDNILSGILLCIPFQVLQHVLEVLIDKSSLPNQKAKIFAMVKERERRRKEVLGSKSVSLEERNEQYIEWEPVGWQEKVEFSSTSNGLSCKLTRKWAGLKDPAGSSCG